MTDYEMTARQIFLIEIANQHLRDAIKLEATDLHDLTHKEIVLETLSQVSAELHGLMIKLHDYRANIN